MDGGEDKSVSDGMDGVKSEGADSCEMRSDKELMLLQTQRSA